MTKQYIIDIYGLKDDAYVPANHKRGLEHALNKVIEKECKEYANWLTHEVIAGRTETKLWNDYQISKQ